MGIRAFAFVALVAGAAASSAPVVSAQSRPSTTSQPAESDRLLRRLKEARERHGVPREVAPPVPFEAPAAAALLPGFRFFVALAPDAVVLAEAADASTCFVLERDAEREPFGALLAAAKTTLRAPADLARVQAAYCELHGEPLAAAAPLRIAVDEWWILARTEADATMGYRLLADGEGRCTRGERFVRRFDLAAAERPGRYVLLVRHAEKEKDGDPVDPGLSERGKVRAQELARHLAHAGITHAFTTQYLRTQDTVAPVAKALGLVPRTLLAEDSAALVRELLALPAGARAVAAGHSNTVPLVAQALGVPLSRLAPAAKSPQLPDAEYDRMVWIRLPARAGESGELLELRSGD